MGSALDARVAVDWAVAAKVAASTVEEVTAMETLVVGVMVAGAMEEVEKGLEEMAEETAAGVAKAAGAAAVEEKASVRLAAEVWVKVEWAAGVKVVAPVAAAAQGMVARVVVAMVAAVSGTVERVAAELAEVRMEAETMVVEAMDSEMTGAGAMVQAAMVAVEGEVAEGMRVAAA